MPYRTRSHVPYHRCYGPRSLHVAFRHIFPTGYKPLTQTSLFSSVNRPLDRSVSLDSAWSHQPGSPLPHLTWIALDSRQHLDLIFVHCGLIARVTSRQSSSRDMYFEWMHASFANFQIHMPVPEREPGGRNARETEANIGTASKSLCRVRTEE